MSRAVSPPALRGPSCLVRSRGWPHAGPRGFLTPIADCSRIVAWCAVPPGLRRLGAHRGRGGAGPHERSAERAHDLRAASRAGARRACYILRRAPSARMICAPLPAPASATLATSLGAHPARAVRCDSAGDAAYNPAAPLPWQCGLGKLTSLLQYCPWCDRACGSNCARSTTPSAGAARRSSACVGSALRSSERCSCFARF
jgi:hypothetical protein